jgi:hypothetical protein
MEQIVGSWTRLIAGVELAKARVRIELTSVQLDA